VPWMAEYTRVNRPEKIVWRQEEVLKSGFYWVGIKGSEAERGKEIRVQREGNTISIDKCDYSSLTIYLDDSMADLDKPVTVVYDGKTLFEGKVTRSPKVMRETLLSRQDPSYIFSAKIEIQL